MTKAKQVFKVGDRVAERPKASVIPGLRPEAQKIAAKCRNQRYGTVLEVFIKVSRARGAKESKLKFIRVLWDGQQSPSEHAQMRLVHEDKLQEILDLYCVS